MFFHVTFILFYLILLLLSSHKDKTFTHTRNNQAILDF
ncbi:hypothetical protein PARMER_01002 [Parabacteroides merdae ATCC 43184]|nr:hypothetical protein PARMER_01002 [Parabacteroides merdae ATCC 43184]